MFLGEFLGWKALNNDCKSNDVSKDEKTRNKL